jgi:hypothetical protein
MSRKSWLACVMGTFVAQFLFSGGIALAEEAFSPTRAITMPNKIQSFDIGWVDTTLGAYFLADRTGMAVDVVDFATGHITQLVDSFAGAAGGNNDLAGPNGIITIGRQVWAGDGDSTVKIIDVETGNAVGSPISTGGTSRADELCYDPVDHLVLIANDADKPPFISFISTDNNQIVGKIVMDGSNGAPKATDGIEQCQWSSRTGKFLLNLPEVNGPGDNSKPGAVLVISPQMKVERTFSIDHDKCAGPQGMALGPNHQVLLGCNTPSGNGKFSTVVIDDNATHIVATLNNESGADEVWFNPGDNHYFLARSSAAPQQLGIVDAVRLTEDPSQTTNAVGAGNAHSVAVDPGFNEAYVPIPSTATEGVCSSAGGTDSQGCIAVYSTTNDDRIARRGRGGGE